MPIDPDIQAKMKGTLPPWEAFPDLAPEDFTPRQGSQELYADQVFRPFWEGLTEAEKDQYFTFWEATDDWRRTVTYTFEPVFDDDIDWDEIDAARHANPVKPRPATLWQRLFGK